MPLYLHTSIALDPEEFGGVKGEAIDRILSRIRKNCTEDTIELAISGISPLPLKALKIRRDSSRTNRKQATTIAA